MDIGEHQGYVPQLPAQPRLLARPIELADQADGHVLPHRSQGGLGLLKILHDPFHVAKGRPGRGRREVVVAHSRRRSDHASEAALNTPEGGGEEGEGDDEGDR